MTASYNGHTDIVRMLIEANAHLNIQEKKVYIIMSVIRCQVMYTSTVCSYRYAFCSQILPSN